MCPGVKTMGRQSIYIHPQKRVRVGLLLTECQMESTLIHLARVCINIRLLSLCTLVLMFTYQFLSPAKNDFLFLLQKQKCLMQSELRNQSHCMQINRTRAINSPSENVPEILTQYSKVNFFEGSEL